VLPWSGEGQRHALVLRYKPFRGGGPSGLNDELAAQLPELVQLLRRGKL
jgi:hypothetical protein